MAVDGLLHGLRKVLNAETDAVETQAAQCRQLLARRDAWIDFDGNLGIRDNGEMRGENPPQTLELLDLQKRRRTAAKMNLINSARPQNLRQSAGFGLQPFQERFAWIAHEPFLPRHDFLGAGAVIAQLLAERDVHIK